MDQTGSRAFSVARDKLKPWTDSDIRNRHKDVRKHNSETKPTSRRRKSGQKYIRSGTEVCEIKQSLREEVTARERRETLLIEQLEERDQLLREKQQQLTQKEEREETFQTHLREMEQRLRDIETSETRQREQFRVKHLRVEDRQKQLKEYRERDRYYLFVKIKL